MKTKVGRTPSRANELFWQSQLGCFGGNGSDTHGLLDLRPLHSELVVADHPHHVLGLPQSEGTEDRRLDEIVRRFFLVLRPASVLLCAKSKESRRLTLRAERSRTKDGVVQFNIAKRSSPDALSSGQARWYVLES